MSHTLVQLSDLFNSIANMQPALLVCEKTLDLPVCTDKRKRVDFSDLGIYGFADLKEFVQSDYFYLVTFRDSEFDSIDVSEVAKSESHARIRLSYLSDEKSDGVDFAFASTSELMTKGYVA